MTVVVTDSTRSLLAAEVERRLALSGFGTMKALSLAAGLNVTYVRDLLAPGRGNNPKTKEIAALAAALNCTVTELMEPVFRAVPQRNKQQLIAARFRAARWAIWGEDTELAAKWLKLDHDRLVQFEKGGEKIPPSVLKQFCTLGKCAMSWFEEGELDSLSPAMAARVAYSDPSLLPGPCPDQE